MEPIVIAGIVLGIICFPLAVFGAYVGIRQIIQWRRDAKKNEQLQDSVDALDQKVDNIALYLDGLPSTPNKNLRTLFNAGMKARKEYQHNKAIMRFREGLVVAKNPSEKIALLNLIGVSFNSLERFEEALGSYKEAERIARETNNKEGLSRVLNNQGVIYWQNQQLDEALDYLQRALQINKEIGNKQGEAIVLSNIGIVYGIKKDYDKAMSSLTKAFKLSESIGDITGRTTALSNIGILYGVKREFDSSLTILQQVKDTFKEMGDRDREARALYNIGQTLARKGEPNEAQKSYGQSLKMFEGIGATQSINVVKQSMFLLKQAISSQKKEKK